MSKVSSREQNNRWHSKRLKFQVLNIILSKGLVVLRKNSANPEPLKTKKSYYGNVFLSLVMIEELTALPMIWWEGTGKPSLSLFKVRFYLYNALKFRLALASPFLSLFLRKSLAANLV